MGRLTEHVTKKCTCFGQSSHDHPQTAYQRLDCLDFSCFGLAISQALWKEQKPSGTNLATTDPPRGTHTNTHTWDSIGSKVSVGRHGFAETREGSKGLELA